MTVLFILSIFVIITVIYWMTQAHKQQKAREQRAHDIRFIYKRLLRADMDELEYSNFNMLAESPQYQEKKLELLCTIRGMYSLDIGELEILQQWVKDKYNSNFIPFGLYKQEYMNSMNIHKIESGRKDE